MKTFSRWGPCDSQAKKNMKNILMHPYDKEMLKMKAIIETVNDELKNNLPEGSQVCQIEHARHRSFDNILSSLLSGLIAYSFFPKKPSLNLEIIVQRLYA